MTTLHQLRCFLATYSSGSLTAAAAELGYAQPSVSEQVRLLEKSLNTQLFQRVGRGVVPTEAGHQLRPYAEVALAAVSDARLAVASVRELVTGTIRFGVFGTARIYLGADVVMDVLKEHPQVRVELIGQNSTAVQEDLRRGRMEAAVISVPAVGAGLTIHPVFRDQLVYVSVDPARCRRPVDGAHLARASLVLSEASWGNEDSIRNQLARAAQSAGGTLQTRVEVEDIETALEIAASGAVDTITALGVLHRLGDRLPLQLGWVPLRPRLYDTFAIAHREGAVLSPATRLMVDLVTTHMMGLSTAVDRIDKHRMPGGPA